jgi:hypothetical protein
MTDVEPRRPRWPWIAAGVVVLALIAGGAYAVTTLLGVYRQAPIEAVHSIDDAIGRGDCAAFQTLTTEALRATTFSSTGVFQCDDWKEIAATFSEDGDYRFDVTVERSEIINDTAVVVTTETDGASSFQTTYGLVLVDGSWILGGYSSQELAG